MNEGGRPPAPVWSAGDGRATRAIVDLDALAGNVRAVRELLSPGTELMAVVKADGYGHGAVMVARTALAAGAARLAVATIGEGAQLRAAGIRAPILVLGPVEPAEVATALRLDLELTVATIELLDAVAAAVRDVRLTRPQPLHVKLDSGMRRYGAMPATAVALATRVAADSELSLAGLATHFAAADEADERFTLEQAALLDRCATELAAAGIWPERLHAANSAAALRSPRYHYDLVRVGIALYGLPPSAAIGLPAAVRPVLTLRSRVARVFDLAAGDAVGYGRTYRCERPGRAALVPIGYADGYRRALSNRAWMGIGGARAPVLGRVSMDQTVVGLPDDLVVAAGAEVTVAGGCGESGAPSIVELAELLDTIPYEVVTGLGARVPRCYVAGGELIAEVAGH